MIVLVTVRLPNVPTEVKLDDVTPEARVEPLNVPAAAVTVPLAPNEIAVPLIVTDEFVSDELGILDTLEPARPVIQAGLL